MKLYPEYGTMPVLAGAGAPEQEDQMGTTRRKVALSVTDMRVIISALNLDIAEMSAAVPRDERERANQQYLLRQRTEVRTMLEDELGKLELQQAKERQQAEAHEARSRQREAAREVTA